MDHLLHIVARVNRSAAPPDVKLQRLISGLVHWITTRANSDTFALDLHELSVERLRKSIAKRNRLDCGLRRIVQEGVRIGIFRPVDAKMFSFSMWGSLNWIPRWFDLDGPSDANEIGDVFLNFFF